MEAREWRFGIEIPVSAVGLNATVGPGPWDGEPDKAQWEHNGVACMVRRGPMGAWCGYVGVPPGHPLYDGHDEPALECHGGVTYGARCDGDEETGICHVPGPGDPDPLYWIGFDCGHSWDVVPTVDAKFRLGGDQVYRDYGYVRQETERLADQVLALA